LVRLKPDTTSGVQVVGPAEAGHHAWSANYEPANYPTTN
jgi:hypothetical protein